MEFPLFFLPYAIFVVVVVIVITVSMNPMRKSDNICAILVIKP